MLFCFMKVSFQNEVHKLSHSSFMLFSDASEGPMRAFTAFTANQSFFRYEWYPYVYYI